MNFLSYLISQGTKLYNPQIINSLRFLSGWGYIQRLYPILITLIFGGAFIAFLFMIIWGGVEWITSGGNKEKIAEARSRVTNGIIGLVVLFTVFLVVRFLNSVFHINIGGLGVPASQVINTNPQGQFSNLATFNPTSMVTLVIQFLLLIAALTFFFMLITGGIRWITSSGERLKIEGARNQIRDAIIGLFIVLAIFVIMQFINRVFGVNMGGLGIGVCWGSPPSTLSCVGNCSPACTRGNWYCFCPTPTPIPPTPTPPANLILNSATDLTCLQLCTNLGWSGCTSAGTDGLDDRFNLYNLNTNSCETFNLNLGWGCTQVMSDRTQVCSGYQADWIYCTCTPPWHSVPSPTPTGVKPPVTISPVPPIPISTATPTLGMGGPIYNPTNTPTVVPTNTPIPTPTVCSLPTLVTGQNPTGNMMSCTNQVTFRWNSVAGATNYAIRIDENPGTWSGTCSSINPGDTCIDNLSGISYTRSVTPGTSYRWWVDAINSCGWSTTATTYDLYVPACPTNTPIPTATPIPTNTPTAIPRPTNTPTPTLIPTSTPTPRPACITEGGSYNLSTGGVCCSGLTGSQLVGPRSDGSCPSTTMQNFICTRCGDTVCGLGENYCNCSDCQAPTATPTPTPIPLLFCNDSDGGIIYEEQGTVSDNTYLPGNQIENITDTCVSATTIRENYCTGSSRQQVQFACSGIGRSRCVNGECCNWYGQSCQLDTDCCGQYICVYGSSTTGTCSTASNILLNEAININCRDYCITSGFSGCVSIGTDSGAGNGMTYISSAGACVSTNIYGCNTALYGQGVICGGHQANWTNCRCN